MMVNLGDDAVTDSAQRQKDLVSDLGISVAGSVIGIAIGFAVKRHTNSWLYGIAAMTGAGLVYGRLFPTKAI